jgi:hypothetical protein
MSLKKGNEYTMKEALAEMLRNTRLERGLNETKIYNAWEQVMGAAITKYTRNLHIEKSTLFVELSSASLREELSYGRSKIVKMLNDAVGTEVITEVILR